MDRRRFLKSAAGLFIPAVPALILPNSARAGCIIGGGMICGGGGGGALGLQANLGSFFSLDNTLADATGAVTNLTNNGTVTFVTPPGGGLAAVTNCANFVSASSQYLSHVDATGINVAGIDFSLQFWFYATSNNAQLGAKGQNSFGNNEYQLGFPFNATPRFELNNSGQMLAASVSQNAWHHYVVTFDNTSKGAILYIDGASAATNTYGGATGVGTGPLTIGSNLGSTVFWSGNMALYGTWRSRILSAANVTALYNSGAGLSYAAMA